MSFVLNRHLLSLNVIHVCELCGFPGEQRLEATETGKDLRNTSLAHARCRSSVTCSVAKEITVSVACSNMAENGMYGHFREECYVSR